MNRTFGAPGVAPDRLRPGRARLVRRPPDHARERAARLVLVEPHRTVLLSGRDRPSRRPNTCMARTSSPGRDEGSLEVCSLTPPVGGAGGSPEVSPRGRSWRRSTRSRPVAGRAPPRRPRRAGRPADARGVAGVGLTRMASAASTIMNMAAASSSRPPMATHREIESVVPLTSPPACRSNSSPALLTTSAMNRIPGAASTNSEAWTIWTTAAVAPARTAAPPAGRPLRSPFHGAGRRRRSR